MSAPAAGVATGPGHAGSKPSGGSPDGARTAVAEGDTPREGGLRRTVSWADAQPDKDKSVGLVAVREFEPRCARLPARARIPRALSSGCAPGCDSEAGDTEDGYGAYNGNRKGGCCIVQ
jgi:hypothetical protein